MDIRYNRVKVSANGTDASTDFILGDPLPSFAAFRTGEVNYTALASDGTWQVGRGSVSGANLTRGIVEENSEDTNDQMDFSGLTLQIALTLSADYIDDITRKLDAIEDDATRDQTGTEIKGLYEAEDDTNVFDDDAQSKLNNIESLAKDDQIALQVPFTATATVTSTDVQNAIEQVDDSVRNHTHAASEVIYDADTDPIGSDTDLQVVIQSHSDNIIDRAYPATGLISGGELLGSVNTTVFAVTAGEGLYSNTYSDVAVNVLPVKVSWDTIANISVSPEADGLSVANVHVFLLRNVDNVTVVKVVGTISASFYKDHIYLGSVAVVNNTISGITNTPVVTKQAENTINELMVHSSGITGANLKPTLNDLSFWQEAGNYFFPGINWQDTDHKNPNTISFSAVGSDISPVLFNVIDQLGVMHYVDITQLTSEYDDGGVLTALPATKATIHRMYATSISSAQRKYILLLGQNLYDNATEAEDNLANDSIILPPEADNMHLIGYVGVTAESASFVDPTSAWVVSDVASIINGIGTGSTAVWGNITGLLTDQTDLDNRFTALESPDKIIFNDLTGNEPAHIDGQMYLANGVINIQDGYPDVTLQVGREQHMEVINNTGSTISNGSAVRHNGVAGGEVQIALAIADNFVNSRLIGVTTHDILSGQKGLITTFGLVGDIDTSGVPAGVPVYLSDTVAGTFTDTAPDVASLVGGVTVASVTGELFVSIDNNIVLPLIYGNLSKGVLPATLIQNQYTTISNYAEGDNVFMPTNIIAGLINVPVDGRYRVTFNIQLSYDSIGNSEEIIELLLESNDSVLQKSITVSLARNSTLTAKSTTTSVSLLGNKDYHIRIKPLDSTLTNVVSTSELDITSVFIR